MSKPGPSSGNKPDNAYLPDLGFRSSDTFVPLLKIAAEETIDHARPELEGLLKVKNQAKAPDSKPTPEIEPAHPPFLPSLSAAIPRARIGHLGAPNKSKRTIFSTEFKADSKADDEKNHSLLTMEE